MGTYTPKQYDDFNRRRMEMLKRNARRGETLGAEKYAIRLRMYVPINTGKLKRSIVRRGNKVRVGASNNGFPYVHWINQTSPEFVTLDVKAKGKRGLPWVTVGHGSDVMPVLVRGGKMTYGLQPTNWRWTGKVRFAQRALYETRQDWQVLIQKINKKSLMGESI